MWRKALVRRMEYIYHSGNLPTSDALVSATSVGRYFLIRGLDDEGGCECGRKLRITEKLNLGGCVDRRFTARTVIVFKATPD